MAAYAFGQSFMIKWWLESKFESNGPLKQGFSLSSFYGVKGFEVSFTQGIIFKFSKLWDRF